MRCIWLVLLAFACHRDRAERPAPKQAVNIKRLPPALGERFTYLVTSDLTLALTDGTRVLELAEHTNTNATEVVTAVQNDVATERTIRFQWYEHRPLGGEAIDGKLVLDKTYRWNGKVAKRDDADVPVSVEELEAIEAYARGDTGQPDLAAWLLTDREFVQGEPWTIPEDQPAPFAHGKHAGTTITLATLADRDLRPTAIFDITQVLVLQPANQKVPITLAGRIVVDIGLARILSIDIDGEIRERTGPVERAHMQSHQEFKFVR